LLDAGEANWWLRELNSGSLPASWLWINRKMLSKNLTVISLSAGLICSPGWRACNLAIKNFTVLSSCLAQSDAGDTDVWAIESSLGDSRNGYALQFGRIPCRVPFRSWYADKMHR
jgi:hypothetical protein